MNALRGRLFGTPMQGKTSDLKDSSTYERDIYPVHTLDGMKMYQTFVATVMLFNDVLDADMLNASLSRLLGIGDWRKLGGRLKKGLEIHVPQKFSIEQPALTYTHECLTEMKISDHPIAKQLPRHTGVPSIQSMTKCCEFRTLQVRKDFPTSLDAMIEADQPHLSLHVHSFKDATVVGLAWPHTLMDGAAQAVMMRSWSLVMADQEDKMPPIAGARHDLLLDLQTHGDSDQDEFFAEKRLLRSTRLTHFLCRWGWDKLTGPAKVFRKQVLQIGLDFNKKLFISEVDALTAWITQKVALMEPKPRPVTIMSLFNCRYRLEQLLHSESVYAQNMVLMSYTLLSAQEARGAVAPLAISHREQVAKQTTESRVVSFIQWLRKDIEKRQARATFMW